METHFAPLLTSASGTEGAAAAGAVTVVDVGGGSGELLRRLQPLAAALARPLRLVCVDRPEVSALNVAEQRGAYADGSQPLIEFVAADAFTQALPPHADVYVLARVLHDWDDDRARTLLAAVRAAATPTSRLVVLDRLATPAHPHALLSLHMHLLNSGRERRAGEWAALFKLSGWRPAAGLPGVGCGAASTEAAIAASPMHDGHAVIVLAPAAPSSTAAAAPAAASTSRVAVSQSRRIGGCADSGARRSRSGGVLLVNHGYPPLFNAGSEIDTQTTALGLRQLGLASAGGGSDGGINFADVAVFSRECDPFAADYGVRETVDVRDPSIPVYLVNNPREAAYSRYACAEIDDAFRAVMAERRPAVVHFGHVNHLSSSLPAIAKHEFGAATVFTLHDFFLLCPRGQFLVNGPAPAASGADIYELCTRQDDAKCASRCLARRYGEGGSSEVAYWTQWVGGRMDAFRQLAAADVDAFTAPSKQLLERFVAAGAVPRDKMHYLPYGFDRRLLAGRRRRKVIPAHHGGFSAPAAAGGGAPASAPGTGGQPAPFVFAYIGRHEPSKGIHLLVSAAYDLAVAEAAATVPTLPPFSVAIYGRDNGANSAGLRRLVEAGNTRLAAARAAAGGSGSSPSVGSCLVTFEPEYRNSDIVAAVFDRVDAIVVPSIWDENAPLVIHEALQARVPVVTANAGGMAELITNGVNGTQFAHRDAGSLAVALRQVLRDPAHAAAMADRGYLGDPTGAGNVPGVNEQVATLAALYRRVWSKSQALAAAGD